MTREEIHNKTQEVFRDVFEDTNLVIINNTTADDIDDWDSLTHITLISLVEKEFNIKFALGELQELKNVGEMLNLIEKKIKG